MRFIIESDHPDAKSMIERALDNYAHVNDVIAATSRNRECNPGETEQKRQRAIEVRERRAAATREMAATLRAETGPASEGGV